MKIIIYRPKHQATNILNPIYNGYRSKFFNNYNDPTKYADDFPNYIRDVNVTTSNKPQWNQELENIKTILFKGDIYDITQALEIYEDALLSRCYANFISHRPDNFIMAILMILINISPKGNAIIAYGADPLLYDMIYILSSLFNTIRIAKGYIICEHYTNVKLAGSVINFIRYYINCPGDIYPLEKNTEEIKIKKIFKTAEF